MSSVNHLQRKYIMHSAHRAVSVAASPTPWERAAAVASRVRRTSACTLRLLIVCDPFQQEAHESLVALERHFEKHDDIQCDWAFRSDSDEFPGWEDLERADCLLLFARRKGIHGERLHRLRRFCDRGGALVGIGATNSESPVWSALDHEVFGNLYLGSCGKDVTHVKIVEPTRGHAILDGVEPFLSASPLGKNLLIADRATELLWGSAGSQRHLVAWTRPYRAGRVFYTSLGHPDDFLEDSFLRLLANAVNWTSGKPS